LSAPPKKKKAAEKQPAPAKIQQEDLTHLKAQGKDATLKFDEVQDAMANKAAGLEKAKQDWLTPAFFEKLAKSPKLLKAFQNPEYMAAFTAFGQDPKAAMAKYGNNPEFREIMQEFSLFMGDHFGDVADQKAAEAEAKRKQEEEQLKADPVYQTIQTDPQVQEYLKDPEV